MGYLAGEDVASPAVRARALQTEGAQGDKGHLLPHASCARHLCFSSGPTLQFTWKEITVQIREVRKPTQDHTVLDLGLIQAP